MIEVSKVPLVAEHMLRLFDHVECDYVIRT